MLMRSLYSAAMTVIVLALVQPGGVRAIEPDAKKMPNAPDAPVLKIPAAPDGPAPKKMPLTSDGSTPDGKKMPLTPDGQVPDRPAKAPEGEAPAPQVLGPNVDHASADCTTCNAHGKHDGTCIKRICAWLTYQPLHQPIMCCKPKPMPCCPPHNYWWFPCGGNVYGGFPAGAVCCGK
jgi:hypothetical protein